MFYYSLRLTEFKYLINEKLKEFCKNNIGGFKQPQKIVIINLLDDLDDIPKGPTKKILYRELKKYYMENLSDN